MILAQDWPKIAKSSWHNPFNMQKAYYISILGGDVPPCSPNPDPFSDKQT